MFTARSIYKRVSARNTCKLAKLFSLTIFTCNCKKIQWTLKKGEKMHNCLNLLNCLNWGERCEAIPGNWAGKLNNILLFMCSVLCGTKRGRGKTMRQCENKSVKFPPNYKVAVWLLQKHFLKETFTVALTCFLDFFIFF